MADQFGIPSETFNVRTYIPSGRPSGSESEQSMCNAFQSAHDLANFLSGIRMLVKSLAQSEPDDEAVQRHVDSLDRASLHALKLCEQLQLLLHGERRDPDRQVSQVNLSRVVQSMRVLLEVMVRPGCQLNIDVDETVPPIMANPTQVRQVLLDLVTNASDALLEKGSITIRTGIFRCSERPDLGVSAATDDECVYLEVADTGCGIEEKHMQRIFEPSFTTKKDGHGLGLASVLSIVQKNRGAVTVDSRVGKGTRVRCMFPRASTAEEKRAARPTKTTHDPSETATDVATVLMVEDHSATLEVSKSLLESSNRGRFRALTATNGQDAMEILRQQPDDVSVVVIDQHLPDCTGDVLMSEMRRVVSDLPVILTSGATEQQLAAQVPNDSPVVLLSKPFGANELIDKIAAVLDGSGRKKGAKNTWW